MKLCEVCGQPATWQSGTYGGKYPEHYLCGAHSEKWKYLPKGGVLGLTGRFRPKVWQEFFGRFVTAEKQKLLSPKWDLSP